MRARETREIVMQGVVTQWWVVGDVGLLLAFVAQPGVSSQEHRVTDHRKLFQLFCHDHLCLRSVGHSH